LADDRGKTIVRRGENGRIGVIRTKKRHRKERKYRTEDICEAKMI
jgi:hypothetical protein